MRNKTSAIMPKKAKARKPSKTALNSEFKAIKAAIESTEMECDLAKSAMTQQKNKIRGLKPRSKEMKDARAVIASIEIELDTIERNLRDQKLKRRDLSIALGKGSTIKTKEVEL